MPVNMINPSSGFHNSSWIDRLRSKAWEGTQPSVLTSNGSYITHPICDRQEEHDPNSRLPFATANP